MHAMKLHPDYPDFTIADHPSPGVVVFGEHEVTNVPFSAPSNFVMGRGFTIHTKNPAELTTKEIVYDSEGKVVLRKSDDTGEMYVLRRKRLFQDGTRPYSATLQEPFARIARTHAVYLHPSTHLRIKLAKLKPRLKAAFVKREHVSIQDRLDELVGTHRNVKLRDVLHMLPEVQNDSQIAVENLVLGLAEQYPDITVREANLRIEIAVREFGQDNDDVAIRELLDPNLDDVDESEAKRIAQVEVSTEVPMLERERRFRRFAHREYYTQERHIRPIAWIAQSCLGYILNAITRPPAGYTPLRPAIRKDKDDETLYEIRHALAEVDQTRCPLRITTMSLEQAAAELGLNPKGGFDSTPPRLKYEYEMRMAVASPDLFDPENEFDLYTNAVLQGDRVRAAYRRILLYRFMKGRPLPAGADRRAVARMLVRAWPKGGDPEMNEESLLDNRIRGWRGDPYSYLQSLGASRLPGRVQSVPIIERIRRLLQGDPQEPTLEPEP